jgi:hypothetical protein
MDRMTEYELDYGYYVGEQCCSVETVTDKDGDEVDLYSGDAINRLSAYEDTDSTPDELMKIKAEHAAYKSTGLTPEQVAELLRKMQRLEAADLEAKSGPLTLEELLLMDGKPAYVQSGDGIQGWAIVCTDGDSVFFHGPDCPAYFEPDNNFYGMEYDDPDGHFGLHVLGWRAWRTEQAARVAE